MSGNARLGKYVCYRRGQWSLWSCLVSLWLPPTVVTSARPPSCSASSPPSPPSPSSPIALLPYSRFVTRQVSSAFGVHRDWGRCARGDAGAPLFSCWGKSQDEDGTDCGAVGAVAETCRNNHPQSDSCQEEPSASGEAEGSASGDTGKARGDTGKAQGGSVPQGRRADCCRGDRPSGRGERDSEKGPIMQAIDEAWV